MTFDVQQATDTYINSLGAEALAKASAYTCLLYTSDAADE